VPLSPLLLTLIVDSFISAPIRFLSFRFCRSSLLRCF
jgi:hypothetical protein